MTADDLPKFAPRAMTLTHDEVEKLTGMFGGNLVASDLRQVCWFLLKAMQTEAAETRARVRALEGKLAAAAMLHPEDAAAVERARAIDEADQKPLSPVEREELLARRQAMEHSGKLCTAFHKARSPLGNTARVEDDCPFCAVEQVYGDCGACRRPRPIVVLPRVDLENLFREIDCPPEVTLGGIRKRLQQAQDFIRASLAMGGAA